MNTDQKCDQTSLPIQETELATLPAETERTVGRRKLLKALVAAGSAAATTMILPARWFRPATEGEALPAHAQVSSLPTATPPPTIYQYELTIPATANIFGAGHTTPPNSDPCAQVGLTGGTLPPYILLPSGARQVLTFNGVTGLIIFAGGTPYSGPDGLVNSDFSTDISSYLGISGIRCIGRFPLFLGVFLNDAEPADPAPPRLDVTGAIDFTNVSPLLNQTFFIGDGLTGTGSGNVQEFNVPEGATRLFLGITDSDLQGEPGCYSDNDGSFTAAFRITVP